MQLTLHHATAVAVFTTGITLSLAGTTEEAAESSATYPASA
ncbi:hypothetical protein [Streptomyces sp. NPDC000410]